MAPIAFLPVLCATTAFFAVGVIWYGALFGRLWRRAAGMTEEGMRRGHPLWLLLALTFLFEMLVALVLGHQFAMTGPSDRAIWMISIGFGAFVMTPAMGISYLFLRKSGLLFLIDAAHLIVGMAAMGAVFVAFN